jgi:hypothetical protein
VRHSSERPSCPSVVSPASRQPHRSPSRLRVNRVHPEEAQSCPTHSIGRVRAQNEKRSCQRKLARRPRSGISRWRSAHPKGGGGCVSAFPLHDPGLCTTKHVACPPYLPVGPLPAACCYLAGVCTSRGRGCTVRGEEPREFTAVCRPPLRCTQPLGRVEAWCSYRCPHPHHHPHRRRRRRRRRLRRLVQLPRGAAREDLRDARRPLLLGRRSLEERIAFLRRALPARRT